MSLIQNPFRTLGLNSDVLRNLKDSQIKALVSSQYRQLSLIYHPDKGGNSKVFMRISEAYELLEDSDTFDVLKTEYLKRTSQKKRISELEKQLLDIKTKKDEYSTELSNQFLNYLIGGVKDGDRTIFNLRDCEFRMRNTEMGINLENQLSFRGSAGDMIHREFNSLFYGLIVEDGSLFKEYKGKKTKLTNKILIGSISAETAIKKGTIKDILRLTQRINTPSGQIMLLNLGQIEKIEPKNYSFYDNKLNAAQFAKILPFMTSSVKVGSYLFSVNNLDGERYFSLDGQIKKIIE